VTREDIPLRTWENFICKLLFHVFLLCLWYAYNVNNCSRYICLCTNRFQNRDGEEKPGWGAPDGREFGFDDNTYRYNRGHWKYFDEINGKVKEYEMDGEANFQGRQNEHFATDFLVNRGMTFIENASKSKQPFALVLSIPDPHSPNDNRPFYRNMFQDLDFKVPETARKNLKFNPAAPGWNYFDKEEVPLDTVDDFIADYEKTFFVDHMQQYYGMVKCIDYNIVSSRFPSWMLFNLRRLS